MLDSDSTARLGVTRAEFLFSQADWAFREQHVHDYGIDAHVERKAAGTGTGELIALQIKSGDSWFDSPTDGGWWFRGKPRHLDYWLGHVLPVVLVVYNPTTGECFWVHVTAERCEYTDTAWRILIPRGQQLGPDAWDALAAIAAAHPGAHEDPLADDLERLPPSAARQLQAVAEHARPAAVRLAQMLARGRHQARFTVETVLAAEPTWMAEDRCGLQAAVGWYATEHDLQGLASTALESAAAASPQPNGRLWAHAAMCAVAVGDLPRAADLTERIGDGDDARLLKAMALACVQHPWAPGGFPPVPPALAAATAAELDSELACVSFLAQQTLAAGDPDAAVSYAQRAHLVAPDNSAAMVLLARTLQSREELGRSANPVRDLREATALARKALEQRRRWDGPSEEPLALLMRHGLLNNDFDGVMRLAGAAADSGITDREARCGEVAVLATAAALAVGDRTAAAAFAQRAADSPQAVSLRAMTADPDTPPAEQARLWTQALQTDPAPDGKLRALSQLASLGELPETAAAELAAGIGHGKVLLACLRARHLAARGDLDEAVGLLRAHPGAPMAAEILVDLLTDAGRLDDALYECAQAVTRFGAAVFTHKHLNLLVRTDRTDELRSRARTLLARADTPPQARERLYRGLIHTYVTAGEWDQVEQCCRDALAEHPGQPDVEWIQIFACYSQGRPDDARAYLDQLDPPISRPEEAGLWFDLHARSGLSGDDVTAALDLVDRWPDAPQFQAQILGVLLTGSTARTRTAARVVPELDEPLRTRIGAALHTYTLRHPDGPLRRWDSTPQQLLDRLRTDLAARARMAETVMGHIAAGQIPLGVLATVLDRPYTLALLHRETGVLLAVTDDPAAFAREIDAAEAALGTAIVAETSALALAALLPGRWPALRARFSAVTLTRDAWNDLAATGLELRRDDATGFTVTYDEARDVLVRHDLPATERERLTHHLTAVEAAAATVTITDPVDPGAFAAYRFSGNEPWLSPLAYAAHTGRALWSDDAVLRSMATQHGVPAFGTLALLHVLIDQDAIEDTLRDDVTTLADHYVVELTLTPDELHTLAEAHHWQPGPATALLTRAHLWQDPTTALATALDLIAAAHDAAPATTEAWLAAACTGMATRVVPADRPRALHALATAAADRIGADAYTRGRFATIARRQSSA